MKNLFLTLAYILTVLSVASAQDAIASITDMHYNNLESIDKVDSDAELAQFLKIQKEVIKKIQSEIVYPEVAYEYRLEGTVLLEFTFDGEVSKIKVKESMKGGCEQAALDALNKYAKYYKELGGKKIKPKRLAIPFTFGFN